MLRTYIVHTYYCSYLVTELSQEFTTTTVCTYANNKETGVSFVMGCVGGQGATLKLKQGQSYVRTTDV